MTRDFDVLRKGTKFEISMLMCVCVGGGMDVCLHAIVCMS